MPLLADMGVGAGKRARLYRMLYHHGVGNGTALFLPYDQGLEHGPRDFFANPAAADPGYVIRLAIDGGFNGVVLQIGNAAKYYDRYAGQVPLILKLNGKTDIPSDDEPISPLHSSVEDAVALGADAVGYTLYIGSPRQADDFAQFRQVRQDAERYGMPVIVWAYPRGSAIRHKGGQTSFYAVDYAARVAAEVGADMVKVIWPDATRAGSVRPEYDHEFSATQMLSGVVDSAGQVSVLLSGGARTGTEDLVDRARVAMDAGVTGLIFGRNFWQRERAESLRLIVRTRNLLARYPVAAGELRSA